MIVGTARQSLGYFRPFVAQFAVCLTHNAFFFFRPVGFVDVRVWYKVCVDMLMLSKERQRIDQSRKRSVEQRVKGYPHSSLLPCQQQQYGRTQMIVPALSALFAGTSRNGMFFGQILRNERPTLRSVLHYHLPNRFVFFVRPNASVQSYVYCIQKK